LLRIISWEHPVAAPQHSPQRRVAERHFKEQQ
jgi:hypothetical protein